jgi:predicted metal-dependent hydrolase
MAGIVADGYGQGAALGALRGYHVSVMPRPASHSRIHPPAAQLSLELAPAQLQASPLQAADELPHMEVRRHPRARRLSIRVHPGGRVVVVVPRRSSAASIQRFIGEHRDWIIRTSQQLAPTEAVALPTRLSLPALRRELAVNFEQGGEQAHRWSEQGGILQVRAAASEPDTCMRSLRDWLLAQARRTGPTLVAQVSAETGLAPARLQFRLQRTRWGSCSSRGTVSLNACMLFLEGPLLRYLLLHELCHLRHMNHSRRYWALVGSYEPDYRALDRALDQAWREVPGWVFGGQP